MKLVLAAMAPLLVACSAGGSHAPVDARSAVHGDGPYAVGEDIDAGVWTSQDRDPCNGFTARTRDFDILHEDSAEDFLAGSSRVGDLQRIVLRDGEFFFSDSCSTWTRETSSASSPDPATTAGACTILVGGDDLVKQTLALGHRPASERDASDQSGLQDRLFAVVTAGNKRLGPAAGQLVDYLDDPDGYNVGSGTIAKVTRAVDRIRSVCRG